MERRFRASGTTVVRNHPAQPQPAADHAGEKGLAVADAAVPVTVRQSGQREAGERGRWSQSDALSRQPRRTAAAVATGGRQRPPPVRHGARRRQPSLCQLPLPHPCRRRRDSLQGRDGRDGRLCARQGRTGEGHLSPRPDVRPQIRLLRQRATVVGIPVPSPLGARRTDDAGELRHAHGQIPPPRQRDLLLRGEPLRSLRHRARLGIRGGGPGRTAHALRDGLAPLKPIRG